MRGYLQRQHPGAEGIERALARSLTELQQHGEAEQLLRAITTRNPKSLSALMDLGLCLHRQNKHQDALQCFERVQTSILSTALPLRIGSRCSRMLGDSKTASS